MSDPYNDPAIGGREPSTRDVATGEAKSVEQEAQQGGKHVAATARDEAQQVAGEAKGHAQDLFYQVRSEAGSQASTQQQRAAEGLRSISGELEKMATGADSSMASNLVSQAAGQLDQVARWLGDREPADLLDDVKRYARRNPGTFLAIAATVGLVGGRLTRGLQTDAQREAQRREGYQGHQIRYDTGYTAPVGTGYVEQTYVAGTPAYTPTATYPADPAYREPGDQDPSVLPSAQGYSTQDYPERDLGDDRRGFGDVPR